MKKQEYEIRTLKTTLQSIIKTNHLYILEDINNIVILINILKTHILQFSKLYLLHLYNANQKFPLIDSAYLVRVLTISNHKRKDFTKNMILTIFL